MKQVLTFYKRTHVVIVVVLFLNSFTLFAQTGPYDIPPRWHFGNRAGMNFSSGSPVVLTGGMTDAWTTMTTVEAATNVCDPSGNIVFYTDGYRLYDQSHNTVMLLNGSTSSTQVGVSVPDPADPDNQYYLFTANADPGGSGDHGGVLGINWYRIRNNGGTSISVIGGPVQIASNTQVTEQLCAGVDGNGGYWIVAHEGGNGGWQNWGILAWPVTAAGVGAQVRTALSTVTPWNVYTVGNCYWHGSMKINKCQTLLAAVYSTSATTGDVEIFNWDYTTGTVTSLLRRVTGYFPPLYGCEFSPDGSKLYITALESNKLYQLDISSGTVYTDPTWISANNAPEMGTLQLGPDGKIYVTNGSDGSSAGGTPAYIGVINNPNNAGAACNYSPTGFLLNAGPGVYPNIDKGISNLAWFQPRTPVINNSSCQTVNFNYNFRTYFNNAITVTPNSEQWDFGEGAGFQSGLGASPSNLYEVDGTYTVKLKVTDQACGKTWTSSKSISSDCSLPVEWITVKAERDPNGEIRITWGTAKEINNNYFIIERSPDGKIFEEVGVVKGTNNIGFAASYEYYDKEISSGEMYYRIKQVDIDGKYSHSPVVAVKIDEDKWSVVPNPSSKDFNLMIPGDLEGRVLVYDVLGREIFASPLIPGLKFGEEFESGAYIVKIIQKEENSYRKIIKE